MPLPATPYRDKTLWSAEQVLRAGTCGALVFWSQYVQASSLRRLHLAAQSSESLFVMERPLAAAQDASPALLRLALRPSAEGLTIDVVKRRGPARAEPLSVPLQATPFCFPAMRVFLAVHLPKLPLEVFRPKWSPEPAHGCVVLEKDKVV